MANIVEACLRLKTFSINNLKSVLSHILFIKHSKSYLSVPENGLTLEICSSTRSISSDTNGKITNKTCKTDARMLRYVRRKTGCIPIIPTLEKKALLKESWNESDDEFLIFGQNGLGMSSN